MASLKDFSIYFPFSAFPVFLIFKADFEFAISKPFLDFPVTLDF